MPCSSIFSEPSKELSIIIPAYNEEDRLPATLQETLRCGRELEAGSVRWVTPSSGQQPAQGLKQAAIAYHSKSGMQSCGTDRQQPAAVFHQLTGPFHLICPRLRSYLQRRRDRQGASFTYEVIIVDDGSSDGTVRAASEFVRRHGFDAVRVLRLPQNCGKGYAGGCGCAEGGTLRWAGLRGMRAEVCACWPARDKGPSAG